MTTSPTISPGTPAWEELKDEIMATEDTAATYTNAARDALLKQGQMFLQVAPDAVKLMAEQTGVSVSNARTRRKVAAAVSDGSPIKILLDENPEISVSFDTLNALLGDADPKGLLEKLFDDAKANGEVRITRDAARRARGIMPGTVGTPDATADRMARDPEYATQVLLRSREALAAAIAANPLLADAVTENDAADKALNSAWTRSSRGRAFNRAMLRSQHEAEADPPAKQPLKPMEGLTALWAIDAFLERAETAPRTDEGVEVLRLFAEALNRSATFAAALAAGEHLVREDDFDAGLSALLEMGDPS